MIAVLGLLTYMSGAALLCFAVYGALRWLYRVSPVAFYLLATLGLLAHLLVLSVFGFFCLAAPDFNPDGTATPPPFAWSLLGIVLAVFAIWGISMVGGTIILRRATRGQMTRLGAFLFCPVYWVASFAATGGASILFGRGIERCLTELSNLLRDLAWPDHMWGMLMYPAALLLWLFPLGVPLCTLAVANFLRLSLETTSGSLA